MGTELEARMQSKALAPTTPLKPFAELIEDHDLAKVPAEASNQFENDPELIPNRAHFIYVVNPFKDENQRKLIAEFKRLNPDYATTLWIDKKNYDSQELIDLTVWAKENHVHLLDINETLGGHMGSLESHYQFEILRKKPGAASDILRTIILQKFGGIYSDIDVLCKEPLGDIRDATGCQVNFGKRQTTSPGQHPFDKTIYLTEESAPNNDVLVSRPDHPFLEEYITQIHQNYEKTAEELFHGRRNQDFDYDEAYKTVGNARYRKQWTIYVTGPGALQDAVIKTKQFISQAVSVANKFIFGCSLSWMNEKRTEQLTENEEVQRLVTCLSVDLYHEPRVLRLATYASLCSSDKIFDKAIDHLIQDHPEYFTRIETIHDIQEHHQQGFYPDGRLLFNKNYFPNLNRDGLFVGYVNSIVNNPNPDTLDKKIANILALINNPDVPIQEKHIKRLFKNWAYSSSFQSTETQTKIMITVIEELNQRFGKDFRKDISKVFNKRPSLEFTKYLVDNGDGIDWNKYRTDILLRQLAYIGRSPISITAKKEEAKALVNRLLPRITDVNALVEMKVLIEEKGGDYAYLREERGFYGFFQTHGNTNTWKSILSQIKSSIDQQIKTPNIKSPNSLDKEKFSSFKKIMNEHTGRGFGAVTHAIGDEIDYDTYLSSKNTSKP
ncbi:glycosyltransferase [Legionella lansingensis]|uniref:Glycosyltransferase n=1 Tax=Legionella lansingensis TaxID=45067 RepID=A0A0W0VIX6_9GAMM|nr:glycosyltransferase [Legionella lansingensis]KTD20069.1 glycosyltransferase [Legionella lansingensis]SNV51026.1 glycosyltransferase [Legionella lansingensis]